MDIVEVLKQNSQSCTCASTAWEDCQCDVTWADYCSAQAIKEIVRLRRLVDEYEDTIRYLNLQVSRTL